MTSNSFHLYILGGGIAGLTTGYFARKRDLPFTIIEAQEEIGGNAITFRHGDFLFDSGAHRVHDKDPDATQELQSLLGKTLKYINVPSKIYDQGKWINFPLSPWNLLKHLGPHAFIKAGLEIISAKVRKPVPGESFEAFALNTYGRSISERFLLNYSTKLWGRPCNELSPRISGKRLEGLNLKTFFIETLLGERSKNNHLDGAFLYPDYGIGMIAKKMTDFCGPENVRTKSKISRILHDGKHITGIEINSSTTHPVNQLLSTLPLDMFLRLLNPKPPAEILHLAERLTYRHVILTAFTVHKQCLGKNASVYFPGRDFPFTRIYEPKQRSSHMAPHNRTSLVAEISCGSNDPLWSMSDKDLRKLVEPHLLKVGWVLKKELGDMITHRMPYAYPVQNLGIEATLQTLHTFCQGFENLKISGRNGLFTYIHIHDLICLSRNNVSEYADWHAAQKADP